MNQTLYHDEILEYWRHPRFSGRVVSATHKSQLENVLCGDRLSWTMRVANATIEQAAFEADGCALSVAGASVVAEEVQGKTLKLVRELNFDWLKKRLGINPSPARSRCLTLGLEAFYAAFER